jgi:polysaccharide export outer membrane protein
MLNKVLWKPINHSIMGIILLTVTNSILPTVCLAAQQSTPLNNTISDEYILGGGDHIQVSVFGLPEYTGDYEIPPDGVINLPLIGGVEVIGLTTDQAANLISTKYAHYLKRPIISVNLANLRPINVVVAGEVISPGAYTLNLRGSGGGSNVEYPTVLAALTIAQGVTLSANISKVELHRKTGTNPEQVVLLDLKQLTQTGKIAQDLTLRDGDTIVVPTATKFDVADSRNLFSASFAASQTAPRSVVITGEVLRPGKYIVGAGGDAGSGLPSVMRTIQLAGGVTPHADVRHIELHRTTRTRTEQIIDINLWKLLSTGDINQDVIVQDRDTIYVPKASEINLAEATQLASTTLSPEAVSVGVIGEVKRPGVTPIKPNSSLNQAILAAGGFNDERAKTGSVELIRLNPDGTVTKRLIKVDYSQGINDQTNPILQNNDVVLVNRSSLAKTGDNLNLFASPIGLIFNLLRVFGL